MAKLACEDIYELWGYNQHTFGCDLQLGPQIDFSFGLVESIS